MTKEKQQLESNQAALQAIVDIDTLDIKATQSSSSILSARPQIGIDFNLGDGKITSLSDENPPALFESPINLNNATLSFDIIDTSQDDLKTFDNETEASIEENTSQDYITLTSIGENLAQNIHIEPFTLDTDRKNDINLILEPNPQTESDDTHILATQQRPLFAGNAIAHGDSFFIFANQTLAKSGRGGILSNDLRVNSQYEVIVTQTTSNGSLFISDNGTLSYTPNLNYTGTDTFQYQLRHVNSGRTSETVTVSIQIDANGLSNGNDIIVLGNIANIIEATNANFDAGDTITGGNDTDTINFSDTVTITTGELANKTNIDVLRLNADGNSIQLNDAFVDASDTDTVTINNQSYTVTSLDVTDLDSARTVTIGGTGTVTLADGGQTVTSADGVNTTIVGGTGNDTVINGTGIDNLNLGNGDDTFETSDANFIAADTFTGGSGTDTINFTDAATITTAELANKTGIETLQLNTDGNSIQLNDAFVDASDTDTVTINNQSYTVTSLDVTDLDSARTVTIGGTGTVTLADGGQTVTSADGVNTTIVGGTGNDTAINGTGIDNLNLGDGDDIFETSDANFIAADTFTGGSGTDTIIFTTATDIQTSDLVNKTGIDVFQLSVGGGTVRVDDAFVDASDADKLIIDNQTYGFSINVSDLNIARSVEISGTGWVTLINTVSGQRLSIQDGVNGRIIAGNGDDTIIGGTGDDSLYANVESDISADDAFIGGSGTDIIMFANQADITLAELANKTGVDTLRFFGSNNTITLSDAFVDASDNDNLLLENNGNTITSLDVTDLDSARTVTIGGTGTVTLADGGQTVTSADGVNTTIVGGTGNDTVINGTGIDNLNLGNGDDIFETSDANFIAADTFTGGSGTDTINFTDAATITTAELANKTGIETLQLNTDGNSIQLNDTFVDASDTDTVTINNQSYTVTSLDVTDLDSARTVTIGGTGTVTLADGGQTVTSADGVNTTIVGGTGNDTVINGTGIDNLNLGDGDDIFETSDANFIAADTFTGGSGTDTINFTDAATITTAELANKTGIETLQLNTDGNSIQLNDAFVDASDTDTVTINNQNYSVTSLDVTDLDNARTVEISGSGTVDLAAGGQRVASADGFNTVITNGSGTDTIIGGSGINTIRTSNANFTAADTFSGGGSNDVLTFIDTATVTSSQFANKTGIERLKLGGNNSNITLSDSFVDAADADDLLYDTRGYTSILDVSGVDSSRTVTLTGTGTVTLAAGTQRVSTTGNARVELGNGDNFITGGSGQDRVYASEANFSATDVLNGGAGGGDSLRFTDTATITGAELANKTEFERIFFEASGNSIELTDAFVASSNTEEVTISNDTNTVISLDTSALSSSNKVWVSGSGTVTLATGDQTVYADNTYNVDIEGNTGNDTFYHSNGDGSNGSMDGNAGFDTLVSQNRTAFDLSGKAGVNFEGFEKVDISDEAQTLTLTAQDVLDMSDTTDTLFVYGGSNDAVTSTGEGWVAGGTTVATDGLTYQLYTSGSATLGVYTADSMVVTLS